MAAKKSKTPNFIDALNLLEQERGIDKMTVLDALKEALEKAYKKNYAGSESIIRCTIDGETGRIRLFDIKQVVDDVMDEDYQLSEEEAQEINPKYKVGDEVVTEISPEVFGRLAAIQTKQLLRQKIREAEKEALYQEYVDKQDEIINGLVERVEPKFAIVNIGKTGALLPLNAQIPGEQLVEGQHLKVYVSVVERGTKGTHIGVSRTDPGLVKRLFEMNVPEIYDGTVVIHSVSREPGERSKISVSTENPDIDPIGSCVGPKGTRVRNVVTELNGEQIDIIEYSDDLDISLSAFIIAAMPFLGKSMPALPPSIFRNCLSFFHNFFQPVIDHNHGIGIHAAVFLQAVNDVLVIGAMFLMIQMAPLGYSFHALIDCQIVVALIVHHSHDLFQRPLAAHAHIIDRSRHKWQLQIFQSCGNVQQSVCVLRKVMGKFLQADLFGGIRIVGKHGSLLWNILQQSLHHRFSVIMNAKKDIVADAAIGILHMDTVFKGQHIIRTHAFIGRNGKTLPFKVKVCNGCMDA